MDLGVIGLGRMGGNIVRRLQRYGHQCLVLDRDMNVAQAFSSDGAVICANLPELVQRLKKPRAIWIMLPAGKITEGTVQALADLLSPEDIIIDGGNSFYKDDIRRAAELRQKRMHYVDCGTSGGVWGLQRGYCLMIGGDKDIVTHLDPIFSTLAPGTSDVTRTPGRQGRDQRVERGYMHCGPSGAGHFVKMIHNGIEYGLMQAYAEGLDILRQTSALSVPEEERFTFDLADIAEVWRRGSVIGSWLLDLASEALAGDPNLSAFSGTVEDSGEGRWALKAAIDRAVPADVLAAALFARFRSRDTTHFSGKMLSAMRHEFGGHVEPGHVATGKGA